jgi:hypothetical protein
MIRAHYTIISSSSRATRSASLKEWERSGIGYYTLKIRSPCSLQAGHLRLKDDCGSRIFLDIRVPHGVQKRNFTTPDSTDLTPRILSLPKTPTEVMVDKGPAGAAPTFLPLLRDCKSYDVPI